MPTDVQEKSWYEISKNNHVLVMSPTGSGKTLAAFLWAINQLVTKKWSEGEVRVLYVSPLRALNNDIYQNLLKPLDEIKSYFIKDEIEFPQINVLTRSGDTPYEERYKMQRTPPEILITTPETLNIMLTSANTRRILTGIKTVIIDEIHAVIREKRGTHLITAVERLVPICGEFQLMRI
ncbi:DEAD/DEAH box helicase [Candidatus Poribacteria bacterium]|nr:DEAD/DEAH box helicase [Candidatus Poribacteria bacterium]